MKVCSKCGTRDNFYAHSTYCKLCQTEINREYRRGSGWKGYLLSAARRRAKVKNLPFSLTAEDFEIPEFCPVLGIKLVYSSNGKRGPSPDSASLDRIDPALGYIPGNIQVISVQANNMKSNASPDELRRFAAWINKEYPEGGDAQ